MLGMATAIKHTIDKGTSSPVKITQNPPETKHDCERSYWRNAKS